MFRQPGFVLAATDRATLAGLSRTTAIIARRSGITRGRISGVIHRESAASARGDLQKWPTHLMPKNGIHHPCVGEGVPGNVAASIEAWPGLRWRLWRRYKQDILPMG